MSAADAPRGGETVGMGATSLGGVVAALVELADSLVDDFDVVEFLDGLAARAVQLLPAVEAGVVLADDHGESLHVVAASTERSRLLEVFQVQNDEGPCRDCFVSGRPVLVADLADEGARWPAFTPEARGVGFASVLALPLRLRDRVIGGLDLLAIEPAAFSTADRILGQALADVAAISLLQERALRESRWVSEQLQRALNARIAIEQAKGMLAERTGEDVGVAYERLRSFARSHNRLLRRVAEDLLEGRLRADELPDGPVSRPSGRS